MDTINGKIITAPDSARMVAVALPTTLRGGGGEVGKGKTVLGGCGNDTGAEGGRDSEGGVSGGARWEAEVAQAN